jgi:hypothetical protein
LENRVTDQKLPTLHPDELAEIRRTTGRADLTNDEAQVILRKDKVEGAFWTWLDEKEKGQ